MRKLICVLALLLPGMALAAGGNVLVVPDPAADGVVGGCGRDKDTCAPARVHQPLIRHIRKRPAHGVTVYAEFGGQLRLGRELVAGGITGFCDIGGQGDGDGFP